jgi:calcineurin-like phosphoesterase
MDPESNTLQEQHTPSVYGGVVDSLPSMRPPSSGEDLPGSPKKPGDITLVDFHAESAREKEALAYYLDGRASLVVGTHTHVQTADERLLPQGTGYITDLGMTGTASGSVIGMDPKICLDRARNQVLYRMECAEGTGMIQGVMAEIDEKTGKAVSITRISCS